MRTLEDRFWSKIQDRDNGCKEWVASTNRLGYGTTRIERKFYLAHRFVWELTKGPIPEGLCVLHSCDNPPCCNIEHLWLGTRDDNNKDRMRKGRGRSNPAYMGENCLQGHPYSEENTYVSPQGHRRCRICNRAYRRLYGKANPEYARRYLHAYYLKNREALIEADRQRRARIKAAGS